jgi:hypothetical protein
LAGPPTRLEEIAVAAGRLELELALQGNTAIGGLGLAAWKVQEVGRQATARWLRWARCGRRCERVRNRTQSRPDV